MVLRSLVKQLSPRALGRWICVLPVAVKNFLRPAPRPGSPMETRRRQQRAELGALLTDAEAEELLDSASTHPG